MANDTLERYMGRLESGKNSSTTLLLRLLLQKDGKAVFYASAGHLVQINLHTPGSVSDLFKRLERLLKKKSTYFANLQHVS